MVCGQNILYHVAALVILFNLICNVGKGASGGRGVMFVCFVFLHPKSTAMVMARRSVQLTHFFLGKLEQAVNQYSLHILSLVTDNNPP